MLRKRKGVMLAVVLAGYASGVWTASAFGRQAPAKNEEARKIRTTTSLVLVDALVEDRKSGAPIEDLSQGDFALHDNGKPAPISSFNRGKDQKLRPVQLWFVLMCNEEEHFQAAARRRSSVELTEQWGVSFLADKAKELLPALEHLRDDETVGVAHWCDNGESEIDVAPTRDHEAAVEAMDQIARKKKVFVEEDSSRDPRGEVTRLINNVAGAAFPQPFLAIIFVGGKESGGGGKTADMWSGYMEVSSMDFGVNGGGGSESQEYAVKKSDYVVQLGMYLDSLHRRYELGFVPLKQGKNLHRVGLALTKETKERYPNATLRYRGVYNDADQTGGIQSAQPAMDWKKLDSKMREAVKSPADFKDLKFIAQRNAGTAGGTEQFLVRITQNDLTWKLLPNGDRRCVVMAVVASYSSKGQPVAVMVKELEIVLDFDRMPTLKDKPVMLSLKVAVPKGAAKVRVLVRDVATGHIGAQDIGSEKEEGSAAKASG